MNFENKTAIITGGTGGMGKVVVRKFFELGANVAVPVRAASSANVLPGSVTNSRRFLAMPADLTSEADVESFVMSVVQRFGGIHFLINVAGSYSGGKSVSEVSLDEWDGMMNDNLKTTFLMSRAVLAPMQKQAFGRIVNIAALPALLPRPKTAPYAVSKRGVVTLTETIAEEVKGTGVTANAIAPGMIVTDANRESSPDADYSKWVTPEEIAETILFLCSEHARSINGNTVRMFGGM